MKVKNYKKESFLIVLSTVLILSVLSFLPTDLKVFGVDLKPVDIFSDLKGEEEFEYEYDVQKNEPVEKELENNVPSINYASVNFIEGVKDITKTISRKGDEYIDARTSALPQPRFQPLTANVQNLSKFFRALKNAKYTKVRIAHFGDSAIEGDLITAQIRDELQRKFGGMGAGFLGLTSQDINFRTTTKHRFSKSWDSGSIFEYNPQGLEVGINGEVYIPKSRSWVTYQTTGRPSTLRNFNTVRLFFSKANNASVRYSFDGGSKKSARLKSGNGVKELKLQSNNNSKSVRLEIPANSGHFYGVSLEKGNGVYVDNLPLRGNSGVALNKISSEKLKDFNQLMNYKLIILHFGLNVVSSGRRNYDWYEREMIDVVNHLKTAFPDAGILIVGVGDKSVKRGSKFVTDPGVTKLVSAQKDIAEKTGVAFWNLFEAMGGLHSMNEWVKANPPLAFKDYTHFNLQGAEKVAELLNKALMDSYNKYK
jgi:lysophospholipase L1-like esterase